MADQDLAPGELYVVIRKAVVDAIWDVIGTIAMLFLALIVILAGIGFISMGVRATQPTGTLAILFGVVLVVLAVLGVLREFTLWPFNRRDGLR